MAKATNKSTSKKAATKQAAPTKKAENVPLSAEAQAAVKEGEDIRRALLGGEYGKKGAKLVDNKVGTAVVQQEAPKKAAAKQAATKKAASKSATKKAEFSPEKTTTTLPVSNEVIN